MKHDRFLKKNLVDGVRFFCHTLGVKHYICAWCEMEWPSKIGKDWFNLWVLRNLTKCCHWLCKILENMKKSRQFIKISDVSGYLNTTSVGGLEHSVRKICSGKKIIIKQRKIYTANDNFTVGQPDNVDSPQRTPPPVVSREGKPKKPNIQK